LAYTIAPEVGQKRLVVWTRVGVLMSRSGVIFIVIAILIAGALWYLSSQAREVPVQPVEIDVTNEASR
jgi:hypothetical protein